MFSAARFAELGRFLEVNKIADHRSGSWNVRISVAKLMCLIALIAVILNWPPLVLAALPIILYLGYRVLGNAAATGASVLSMLSLALGAAVGALWMRSDHLSDELICRFRGGWVLVRSSRGHVVAGLDSTPGLALPAGANRLEYRCGDAGVPYFGDRPLISPGTLLGPEDDDRFRSGSWAGFVCFESWNRRLGIYRASGVAPFWYFMVLTAAAPLGWATARWRALAHSGRSPLFAPRRVVPAVDDRDRQHDQNPRNDQRDDSDGRRIPASETVIERSHAQRNDPDDRNGHHDRISLEQSIEVQPQ